LKKKDRRHQKRKELNEMNSLNFKKKNIESKNIDKNEKAIRNIKVGLNLKGIIRLRPNVSCVT